jgi:membrane-associated phospholipid phosphatase
MKDPWQLSQKGNATEDPSQNRAGEWRQRIVFTLIIAFLVAIFVWSRLPVGAVQYDSRVATAWFNLSLKLVQETPGYTPPVAARAFGYMGVTLYEAVRPGSLGARSLAGQLNGLEQLPRPRLLAELHWALAANSAMATMSRHLFPTTTPENLAAITELEAAFATQFAGEVDEATFTHSVAWGATLANAIFDWSQADGGHEGYARNFPEEYVPPVGAGMWVRTSANQPQPLQPQWGNNRPFVLASGDECPAPPPPAYSEDPRSQFYLEAWEVYQIGLNLSSEQRLIAHFWSDDPAITATPPGHWVAILGQVLAQEKSTLDTAAEAYAKLGIAVADAFITCWRTKYIYNLLRPITYIQQVIDPNWNRGAIIDPVSTPPFPEYTSGHSVQSSAAATVLSGIFGNEYAFIDATHIGRGLAPRHYHSFAAAAHEAALSRLYGGIHYRSAIEVGVEQGACIGQRVLQLKFR